MLILSPMMVAPVCHVGDPLQLTCTASVEFIRWSIVVVNEHGRDEEFTAFINLEIYLCYQHEEWSILPHSIS